MPAVVEPSFDLLAAALRADAADLRAFGEALATKLEEALPDRTRVERRRGGLFGGPRRVRSIAVDFDDAEYRLGVDGGRLTPERRRTVRGIVLKSEPLDLDAWLEGLARELAGVAERSERSRAVLARMLEA
jgi:hypothetical protein